MRKVILAGAMALICTAAVAQMAPKAEPKGPPKTDPKAAAAPAAPTTPMMPGTTCKSQAAEKKLAGAAMTSFMKKCQTDASKSCEADSKTQNLKGAAKTSHMKKCVNDAVGA